LRLRRASSASNASAIAVGTGHRRKGDPRHFFEASGLVLIRRHERSRKARSRGKDAERSGAGSIRRALNEDEAAGPRAGESPKPLMSRYVRPTTTSHHSGTASGRQEAVLLPQSPKTRYSGRNACRGKTATCLSWPAACRLSLRVDDDGVDLGRKAALAATKTGS